MNEAKFWRSGYAYALAAFCFIFAGLYTFYSGFGGLLFNLSVSTWSRVDANIHSVATSTIYGAKRRVLGYKLIATYSYEFNGNEVISNSVAPDATFGRDQVLLAERKNALEKIRSSSNKVKIFVNLKDAKQSFIFRNKPVKPYLFLIAGALFLTLAFILILMFLQKKRYEDVRDERKLKFPEQPWRWERFWQTFELQTPSNISKVFPIWGLTVFLGIISILSATIIGWSGDVEVPIYFGVTMVFIAWFVSVKILVSRVQGLKKTSGAKLVASSYPIILGKKWSGRIVLTNTQEEKLPEVDYRLHMSLERLVGGFFAPVHDIRELKEARAVEGAFVSAKMADAANNALDKALDSDAGQFGRLAVKYEKSQDKNNVYLDFEILIPDHFGETDLDTEEALRWMLELSAPNDSVSVFEHFPVPVFKQSSFSEPQINS